MNAHGLHFDEAQHRYTLDGKWVPGVTTVLGVLDKPALVKWAAKQVATFVADNFTELPNLTRLGKEGFIKHLAEEPTRKKEAAADRGHSLHAYAEDILNRVPIGLKPDDPLYLVIRHAVKWLDDWQIRPLLVEAPVASRTHWYAGTADLIAEYRNPYTGETGIGIFDWKSTKRIWPEAVMQLNAYAFAEFTGLGGEESSLPEITSAYGIHISERPTVAYPLRFGKEIHEEFVTIAQTYQIKRRMEGDWRTPGTGYVGIGETGNKNYYHGAPTWN